MSFDRLAPVYHLMERIAAGEKMQRCRTAFLEAVPSPRNILTIGEGHGRFLSACRRRFPQASITCVDASAGMLAQSRRRLSTGQSGGNHVTYVQADVLSWTPPAATFDLIATHFFLDCFREDQLDAIVPRLAGAATEGASWLLADFQIAPHGWRRARSRVILAVMYAFFRAVTRLPARSLFPPDSLLRRTGFSLHQRIETEWGLLKSDWWRRGES